MPKHHFAAALFAALLIAIAACEPSSLTDVGQQQTDTRDERDDSVTIHAATDSTAVLGSLLTPTGSRLQFIELRDGAHAGVLVLEEGETGTLVMERVIAAAGGTLNAADLYNALAEPSKRNAELIARLRDVATPADDARPAGWARELVTTSAITALAASTQIACANGNFTSSIPGGFLARNFKRLDTGPKFHPAKWIGYDFDGYTHYWYQALANDTPLWRGKVCGRTGFHPQVYDWLTTVPVLKFMYRSGLTWQQAGNALTFASGNRVWAWIYDGGLGAIDWRIHIYDAYVNDEFDIMMTWN